MVNVTTNLAKTYTSSFNSPLLGFYKATCSVGIAPGSITCPFLLQQGVNTAVTTKGRASMGGGTQYTAVSGDWIAIAVSAQISGLDLNDTNTNVQMFQTSGAIPFSISQETVFSATSKIGLWTWLQGTTVTSLPPPASRVSNCSGLLDCILPNLVFSFCSNQTPACTNASALVWALILSIVTTFFTLKGGGDLLPGIRIPIGEIFTFSLLIWIFVMSGLTLLFVWVPLFFFFAISLAYGKHTGKYL